MKIMLATLILNEMQWIESLYNQHKDWPDLVSWIFVEATDRMFAQANPNLVSAHFLSIDGTTDFLSCLAEKDNRVRHIPFGLSTHHDPAQCKIPARQAYLDAADLVRPDAIIVLDADEFYTRHDQAEINRLIEKMKRSRPDYNGFRFRQRHLWRPQSIATSPLTSQEVIGGYWAIPHTRVWLWRLGMRYANHNTPADSKVIYLETTSGMPQCVHTGFASGLMSRAAKHRYYVARGEGRQDQRQMYVDCRAAFETWKPGDKLPHGASVIPYNGPIPEVLLCHS